MREVDLFLSPILFALLLPFSASEEDDNTGPGTLRFAFHSESTAYGFHAECVCPRRGGALDKDVGRAPDALRKVLSGS